MTFADPAKKQPKSLTFSTDAKTPAEITLPVAGQGVFLFEHADTSKPCTFCVTGSTGVLNVEFTHTSVIVKKGDEQLVDPNNTKGLSSVVGASYWFSLDAQNMVLQAGVGEARKETAVYRYEFTENAENKKWLEGLAHIEITNDVTRPIRLLRDPITRNVPMSVHNTDDLTMNNIASGKYMPVANLSAVNQKLYNCISGKRFMLNDPYFRDFSKAIEYSIVTPGCWCYETLKAKSTEFGDKPNLSETYLRITLNENNGESPGIPYVMEIWPVGHYSPIHNHGGSGAVIRVLHGAIHVKLFSFLGGDQFGSADFKEGDVTWISPTLNQVHQLENQGTKDTCITIQCYMYESDDNRHYDYFDYIDDAGKIQTFEPNSDMEFLKFKKLMRKEWDSRPKKSFMARVKEFFKRVMDRSKRV